MGHSLTGHALVFWLGLTPDAPVDAAVTIGANVWLRQNEPSLPLWIRKRATIEAWRAITVALGRFPARRLRVGTDDEAADYVLDLCRFVRTGRCRRRAGGDYLDALPRVRPPVLALVGGDDDVMCHAESARRFHAPIPRHEVRVVPGVDHMGLVLAPQMADVWRDVAGWILSPAAPRAGR
jgi:pimeloyl-ACP methyl ester carboxylesterase